MSLTACYFTCAGIPRHRVVRKHCALTEPQKSGCAFGCFPARSVCTQLPGFRGQGGFAGTGMNDTVVHKQTIAYVSQHW